MNNPMAGTDPTGFIGVEPGGRPLESICGIGQVSRCSDAGPLTLQQTVQLSNGVEGTVTLQIDAAGNVEIDSIKFSAPDTLGGPDERPNGINMANAIEEHSFRAALAGTDSRFALRPLVSAGLAESNFVPGELVNSVSEQERNIRAIEQEMALTGDRGFTDLAGLASIVVQGGLFAVDLAIPLPPVFTLGKVTRGAPSALNVSSNQFGKKLGKKAEELGLDPSSARDRFKLQSRIHRIFGKADEVRTGVFRGQAPGGAEGPVVFFRRGQDVVVTTPGGDFVTLLQGGAKNSRFVGGKVVP